MNILKLFADSPFAPIQHHSELVKNAVALLTDFVEATIVKDWQQANALAVQCAQLMSESSELYNELVRQLSLQQYSSLASTELYSLLTEQKSVLLMVKKMMDLLLNRKLTLPESLQESYQGFIQAALSATQVANETVNELEALTKEGIFSSKRKWLNNNLQTLHQFESEAARIYQELTTELLKLEENLQPLESLFLYQLLEGANNIVAKAQLIGGRVQLLIA